MMTITMTANLNLIATIVTTNLNRCSVTMNSIDLMNLRLTMMPMISTMMMMMTRLTTTTKRYLTMSFATIRWKALMSMMTMTATTN